MITQPHPPTLQFNCARNISIIASRNAFAMDLQYRRMSMQRFCNIDGCLCDNPQPLNYDYLSPRARVNYDVLRDFFNPS